MGDPDGIEPHASRHAMPTPAGTPGLPSPSLSLVHAPNAGALKQEVKGKKAAPASTVDDKINKRLDERGGKGKGQQVGRRRRSRACRLACRWMVCIITALWYKHA